MRFLPVCAVFLALGAVQAFGAAADGKAVYDAKCKMCHKADGAGNAAMKMKALGSAEVQAKSDADLKKDITGGQRQNESGSHQRRAGDRRGGLHSHVEEISGVKRQRARPGARRFRSRAPCESASSSKKRPTRRSAFPRVS
jgi:hypothetical protein